MKWSDVGGVLAHLAPTLAAAAGGPLAGSAVTALENVLKVIPKPTASLDSRQDALAQTIGLATPETLLAIKTADADFQVQMAQLGFADAEAIAKLVTDDRANARDRQIKIRDKTPAWLAFIITFGFFTLIGFVCIRPVPPTSAGEVNIMIGSLGTAWIGIVTYYFGSSAGSDRKTDIIAASPAVAVHTIP
jgi:hypothetical protein